MNEILNPIFKYTYVQTNQNNLILLLVSKSYIYLLMCIYLVCRN